MTKIVINTIFGGFGLSDKAMLEYAKRKDIPVYPEKHMGCTIFYLNPKDVSPPEIFRKHLYCRDIDRSDPILVDIVEEMREKANGEYAKLKVVDVPNDINWEIHEYDGAESIREVSDVWR